MEPITDISQLRKGDFLSETQYYRVLEIEKDYVYVENERGFKTHIAKNIIGEGMFTAHQYQEEREVTKTEMANIFTGIGDMIFTVNFNKQLREKEARVALLELYQHLEGEKTSQKDYEKKIKKIVKSTFQGEQRTLIGYKIGLDQNLGRTLVVDLEIRKGNRQADQRIRLVDHRTINWLIYQNVRYIVK